MAAGDVIYACGFEALDCAKDGFIATTGAGSTQTETVGAAVTGGGGLHIVKAASQPSAVEMISNNASPAEQFPSGFNKVSAFLRITPVSLPSTGTNMIARIARYLGAGNDVGLFLTSAGVLTVADADGAQPSPTIATLSSGTTYLVEFRIDNSTATQVVQCRVNRGTPQTANITSANSPVDGFYLGSRNNALGAGAHTTDYDDLVYFEGDVWPTDFHSAVEFRVKRVAPDTAPADIDATWAITGGDTKRAQAVDEVTPDDATTYIASSTSGQVQRVPMSAYTLLSDETCKAIQLKGRLGSTATTGTRTATTVMQSAGGTDHGTTFLWSASINGWRAENLTAVYRAAPSAGALDATFLASGWRVKFTKSATADAVRVSTLWAYLVLAVAAPATVQEGWGVVT